MSGTANTTIFTLPVGYRPAYNILVRAYPGGGSDRLIVGPDGAVAHLTGLSAGGVAIDCLFFADA